jgi:predicted 3-demethylubiquinone-9 3-methyltransferase (glyoxalase superfamily)
MVMEVEFELNGQKFVALNGGPEFRFNEAISIQIMCADQDEVDYYWDRLSEGGQAVACGWLKDRYGLSWQVIPAVLIDMMNDGDPQKVRRVTEAMLTMTKLDIPTLEKAAAGE